MILAIEKTDFSLDHAAKLTQLFNFSKLALGMEEVVKYDKWFLDMDL